MDYLAILKDAVETIQGGDLYKTWAKANKGELKTFLDYYNAILAGKTLPVPGVATKTGNGLIKFVSGYAPNQISSRRAAVISRASMEVQA